MNFQCDSPEEPLRVLIINSKSPAAKFLAVKILSGEIFGKNQLIDIVLMVFTNEKSNATGLKFELEKCAFACTNSIDISCNLPSISDADVFCLLTNFDNPNMLDFTKMSDDKQLDTLDLIINVANNLHGTVQEVQADETAQKHEKHKKKTILLEKKARKPIFITDGFVSIHILMSLSNLPSDIFFCPTPIAPIAKSVLGEHLKVQSKVLNNVLVWAANDEIIHVEFEKPLIIENRMGEASPCDRETVGKNVLPLVNLDHTQFSSSWLKKDLIAKTVAVARKNPYGSIYKAASIAKALQQIWWTRLNNATLCTNMGVVSDGSLETIKGCPYVFPIEFSGDTWRVNERFKEDVYLKQEIKRINRAVKGFHEKASIITYLSKYGLIATSLIQFCKKLLLEWGGSSLLTVEEEECQEETGNLQ
ncbi:malate dehydrogenase, cytoplasmic-like [Cydia amplana]|uniref:malate dehydrogenase, cytoplasmic-like n=1 Tax=Cydia amplana TaxID=1869771 RepID=UPI002FE621AD